MQGEYNGILKSEIDLVSMLDTYEEELRKNIIENSKSATAPIVNDDNATNEKNHANEEWRPEEENELVQELEVSSRGKIKGSLILNYFKSSRRPFSICVLMAVFLLVQLFASFSDIWISYW